MEKCVVCQRPVGNRNWNLVRRLYRKMIEQVEIYYIRHSKGNQFSFSKQSLPPYNNIESRL
jgi:hypothetical protein